MATTTATTITYISIFNKCELCMCCVCIKWRLNPFWVPSLFIGICHRNFVLCDSKSDHLSEKKTVYRHILKRRHVFGSSGRLICHRTGEQRKNWNHGLRYLCFIIWKTHLEYKYIVVPQGQAHTHTHTQPHLDLNSSSFYLPLIFMYSVWCVMLL